MKVDSIITDDRFIVTGLITLMRTLDGHPNQANNERISVCARSCLPRCTERKRNVHSFWEIFYHKYSVGVWLKLMNTIILMKYTSQNRVSERWYEIVCFLLVPACFFHNRNVFSSLDSIRQNNFSSLLALRIFFCCGFCLFIQINSP